jgi:L-asparaginase II
MSGAGLEPMQLAAICASHHGFPVHVALVESILAGAGLDESALQCPPGWPIGGLARDDLVRKGAGSPRRLWHNCSGKHAGFLRACVAQGWPIETYLQPDHPLQTRIIEFVSELGEYDVEPVGVDGCGAPVLRTTARAMALLFARLGAEPALAPVFTAMHRYPALVGSNGAADTSLAIATHAAAKGGAEGCLGVAFFDGVGVAVKSWDGLGDIAGVGAVSALHALGRLPAAAREDLEAIGRPPVMGGGKEVGRTEPRVEMVFG